MAVLISVVIATYKRSDMLKRAIDSVLAQTYKDYEIIVVDDNDPQSEYRLNTENCMKQYSHIENVFYYKLNQNSGACHARNVGASHARGEYINFLDDDDEFLPEKFEKQVGVIKKSKIKLGIVGCYARIVDQNNTLIGHEKVEEKGDVFFKHLCRNIATTSLALINRDAFEQSGGWEKMYSSQEHWMIAKVLSFNPYYDYSPEELVVIHHHDMERISTNSKKPLGAIELARKMEMFFPKLSKEQQKVLRINMYDNILMSYSVMKDIKAYRQWAVKKIKATRSINKKQLLRAAIGFENFDKIFRVY